jgi:predicted AlkP superfamily pyrophosphatase or phosphodiesterase
MIARLLAFVLLSLALVRAPVGAASAASPLILVSMDGFRWDYMDLFPDEARTLRTLRREGVGSRGLVPVFPSNTFPNHYTIVTGLLPSNHGMVNNDFFDAELGEFFRYNQPRFVRESRWWGGEPIWVTAIKQGRRAATSFWVGSEAEISGVRPTFWRPYDYNIAFEERLAEVVRWVKLPAAERPAFIALYFEETNGVGHRAGPASPEIRDTVKLLDERLAALLAAVRGEGIEPNVIVVSDHGMAGTSAERAVILEDYVPRESVQIDNEGSVLALRPLQGDAGTLVAAFARAPHVKAYRTEDLPAHLRLKPGPRVAPVWVIPEEGWHVLSRASFERLKARYPIKGYVAGDHGYDPAIRSMHGLFVAHGPAFARGVELPEVENIHVYNLMCAALNLQPAKNDGDDRLVRSALRR